MTPEHPPAIAEDPATLAAEALNIYREIMEHARHAGKNRLEVPFLPMQFALKNRLTRLCAALSGREEVTDAG